MASDIERVYILGIPVDIVSDEDLPGVVEKFYSLKEHRQIILLTFREMMLARRIPERRNALAKAALVLPVSQEIVNACRFLKKKIPPLRKPYPFIIQLLGVMEQKKKSVYLLGSDMQGIGEAENTIKVSFPGLQIVGRYAARYPAAQEENIVTAIKKAAPSLLLAGAPLKERHLWLHRKRNSFSPGVSIWEAACFDVFAGRKPKPIDNSATKFFKNLFLLIFMPWRIFRVFRYLTFFLLLLVEKIRKKTK